MADIQILLGSIAGQWKIWCLINSLTHFMQWYHIISLKLFFLFKYSGCHLSTDAGCVRCHACMGQTPLSQSKATGCVNGWSDFSLQHTFADNCYRFYRTVLIYWICCFPYHFIPYGCWIWRPIFAQLSEVLSSVSCVKLSTRSFCYYQNRNPLYLSWASSHKLNNLG